MNARRIFAALLVVIALAGCDDHEGGTPAPSASASTTSGALTGECLSAMRRQLQEAFATPDAPEATRPDECDGVSDAELQRAADILLAELFGGETP